MTAGEGHPASVLYIPQGGGPFPLLGQPGHAPLVDFLKGFGELLPRPKAILVVSTHWEEDIATVQGGERPELYYDYYGFPPESYEIEYPAPGSPAIAERMADLLRERNIPVAFDENRGFDHGVFVALNWWSQSASDTHRIFPIFSGGACLPARRPK